MEQQYAQPQPSDYNMKFVAGDVSGYGQMNAVLQIEIQNKEKYEKFKSRLAAFQEVSTLEEAKELAQKILPVAKEVNRFRVGNAKCTVILKKDMLRISVDTPEEFISYDFA